MKKKLKIIIIIAVAFGMSALCSNTIFLAGTPYINKPFLAQLRNSPGLLFRNTQAYLASLTKGKDGVAEYQQERLAQYVADQSAQTAEGGSGSGGSNTPGSDASNFPLPPPQNPEEFRAQGYEEIGKDVYEKQNVSANTVEIYFGENAQFEKRTTQIDGHLVETWVPL